MKTASACPKSFCGVVWLVSCALLILLATVQPAGATTYYYRLYTLEPAGTTNWHSGDVWSTVGHGGAPAGSYPSNANDIAIIDFDQFTDTGTSGAGQPNLLLPGLSGPAIGLYKLIMTNQHHNAAGQDMRLILQDGVIEFTQLGCQIVQHGNESKDGSFIFNNDSGRQKVEMVTSTDLDVALDNILYFNIGPFSDAAGTSNTVTFSGSANRVLCRSGSSQFENDRVVFDGINLDTLYNDTAQGREMVVKGDAQLSFWRDGNYVFRGAGSADPAARMLLEDGTLQLYVRTGPGFVLYRGPVVGTGAGRHRIRLGETHDNESCGVSSIETDPTFSGAFDLVLSVVQAAGESCQLAVTGAVDLVRYASVTCTNHDDKTSAQADSDADFYLGTGWDGSTQSDNPDGIRLETAGNTLTLYYWREGGRGATHLGSLVGDGTDSDLKLTGLDERVDGTNCQFVLVEPTDSYTGTVELEAADTAPVTGDDITLTVDTGSDIASACSFLLNTNTVLDLNDAGGTTISGTLGGIGTVDTEGTLTLSGGLAPGTSAGTLDVEGNVSLSGVDYAYEIGDLLDVAGTLSAGGAWTVTVAESLDRQQTYVVATATSIDASAATLGTVETENKWGLGIRAGGSGQELYLIKIPEGSMFILR